MMFYPNDIISTNEDIDLPNVSYEETSDHLLQCLNSKANKWRHTFFRHLKKKLIKRCVLKQFGCIVRYRAIVLKKQVNSNIG
eukprot:395538-Ditylum_brightwellii.AAC.1